MYIRSYREFAAYALIIQHTTGLAAFTNSSTTSATESTITSTTTSTLSIITTGLIVGSTNGSCSEACGFSPIDYQSTYWSRWITPLIVGTAIVVINNATNSTTTTTKLLTEVVVPGPGGTKPTTMPVSAFLNNGSFNGTAAPSRTMSATVTFFNGSESLLYYPTPFTDVSSSIGWAGQIPYASNGTAVCSTWGTTISTNTYYPYSLVPSPVPTHPPWPQLTGSVDPLDPYGRFYTIQAYYQKEKLSLSDIVSLWPNDPFLASIYNCSLTGQVAAATAVAEVSALLATTTAYVSNAASTTTPSSALQPASLPVAAVPATLQPTQPTLTSAASHPASSSSSSSAQKSIATTSSTAAAASAQPSCTNIACFVLSAIGAASSVLASVVSVSGSPLVPTSSVQLAGPTAPTLVATSTSSSAKTSSSVPSSVATGPAAIVVGSSTIAPNSQTQFVIGSSTLAPGSTIVLGSGTSATTFALQTSDAQTVVVVNGVSSLLSTSGIPRPLAVTSTLQAAALLTIGGATIIANPSSQFVVFGSQTLSAGGSGAIASGTTYSLAIGGSAIIVNGQTTPIAAAQAPQTAASSITVAGIILTANSGQYAAGSQTLSPGGSAITVSGTTYSLAASGTAIVVNGKTSAIQAPQSNTLANFVVTGQDGQTITLAQGRSGVVIEGAGTTFTLSAGVQDVFDGVTLSAPSATGAIVVGGTTVQIGSMAANASLSQEPTASRTTTPTSQGLRNSQSFTTLGPTSTSNSAGRPAAAKFAGIACIALIPWLS